MGEERKDKRTRRNEINTEDVIQSPIKPMEWFILTSEVMQGVWKSSEQLSDLMLHMYFSKCSATKDMMFTVKLSSVRRVIVLFFFLFFPLKYLWELFIMCHVRNNFSSPLPLPTSPKKLLSTHTHVYQILLVAKLPQPSGIMKIIWAMNYMHHLKKQQSATTLKMLFICHIPARNEKKKHGQQSLSWWLFY